MREVLVANPGFERGTRYELIGPDPHGTLAPSSLAIYEVASETAVRAYTKRNEGPRDAQPRYTAGPPAFQSASRVWTMLWRRLMSTGDWRALPYALHMTGVNVPPEMTSGGVAEFSSFYANDHMPSVVSQTGFTRGTWFELYRGCGEPPAPANRTFCSLYELDEPTTFALLEHRLAQISVPSLVKDRTGGPVGCERSDELWRLTYRRVGPMRY